MYLLFDVGGTNTRLSISSDHETIGDQKTIPTPLDFESGVRAIVQTAKDLSGGNQIIAAAGSIAGPIDRARTRLLNAPNLPDWINKPLVAKLSQWLCVPVMLENDAALGALGEAVYGAGKGYEIVAFVSIGTGAGGARCVRGKIDASARGFEPGHQIINQGGPSCGCGARGDLESYVSGAAFKKRYGRDARDIADPAIWDEAAHWLAIGLNNVAVLWSPDVIVLGSSMARRIPVDLIRLRLKETLKIFIEPPPLEIASLGDRSGLYGAIALLNSQNLDSANSPISTDGAF